MEVLDYKMFLQLKGIQYKEHYRNVPLNSINLKGWIFRLTIGSSLLRARVSTSGCMQELSLDNMREA